MSNPISPDHPQVSVVVLNRDRICHVARTLKALIFQTHRNFELVVVTNQKDQLLKKVPEAKHARLVEVPEANISVARNAGISHSASDLIAFCDDDAVPEPKWLEKLVQPFIDPKIGAVGGLVRGRNGVSYQWGPQEVDIFGNDWPLPFGSLPLSAPTQADRVIKTVGTNCCFRKSALLEIGGFDQAYRFYLDETDVNFRLSRAGWGTTILSGAEVHHGYASSDYRTSERVPKTLKEIGASKAYFCRKFGDPEQVPAELDGFRKSQFNRLIRAMELGLLPPSEVKPLAISLEQGFIEGARREERLLAGPTGNPTFQPFCQSERKRDILITAGKTNGRDMQQAAANAASRGDCVTLLDFSLTARALTVRFNNGYWHHKGGIFGRSRRYERIFQPQRLDARIAKETDRISTLRDFQSDQT